MKKLFLILAFLALNVLSVFSQGIDCASSDPFCTGTSYNFPASTNVADMGTVGCLYTTPNPAFYYLQIDQSGSIDITMQSTPLVDIDFICWGPFPSLVAACASNLMTNSGVDCSYSTAATEICNIPNAISGEVYILLITNYSNTVCNIDFSQTGGTGTTDCSIMCSSLSNNGPLCVGQTLNLTSTTVSGATYAWTGPNGFTSNLQNPTISSVVAANAGVYSCIVTVNGNSSQPCTTTVVVNLPPLVTVNSPTICEGDDTALTAGGASTYVWSTGAVINPITVNPPSSTSYTVIGTDANGCKDTTISNVTVNPNPIVTVNSATICQGETQIITANGAISYVWDNGQNINPISVTPNTTTSYTVTGTSLGCTGTAVSTITVNPNPIVDINDTTTCSGIPVILTATGGDTYEWSNGSLSNQISVNPQSTSTYTVTATMNGCTGTAIGTVTINATPTAEFTVYPSNIILNQGTFEFTDVSLNASTWSWDFGNGQVSNQQSPSYGGYTSEGSYLVSLTVTNGICSDSIEHMVYVGDVYYFWVPNTFTPNGDGHNDVFIPTAYNIDLNQFSMTIYNRWGEELYKTCDISKPWDGKNLKTNLVYPQGVYCYIIYFVGNDNKKHIVDGRITLLQ